MHYNEESADNSTGRNIWVQLTYPGDEHCPGYTAEESADIGIDGPSYEFDRWACFRLGGESFELLTLSPMLDTPQGISENPHVWYQPQNLVGHA